MKNNQKAILRFASAMLVFVTVLTAVPFWTVDAVASVAEKDLTVSYDFSDGTVGAALSSDYLSKTEGLSGGTVTDMVFLADPTDETNVVIGHGASATAGSFTVKDADNFTDIAILVDSANMTYTLYVNGTTPYYVYDDEITPCVNLPLHFANTTEEITEDFIRLVEAPETRYNDCVIDIGYINVRSTPNGTAMELKGTQTRTVLAENTFDVRFISGIDHLYASVAGYEITAEYTDQNGQQVKNHDISASVAFEKITADGKYVTAEDLGSTHLIALEIRNIPLDYTVTFTAKPYVNRGGVKIYGESYTATFTDGEIVK